MLLKSNLGFIVFPLLVSLSACGQAQGRGEGGSLPPANSSSFPVASDVPQGFTSSNQASYDDVGFASIAFDDVGQSISASGEAIDPLAITGGHGSLPVPSYAEVTNLDTGRTILVRINQQSVPKDRLIRLSLGAARQLGVEDQARFPVRVRRTNPPEFERAVLRQGQPAGERIATPPALLAALRKKLGAAPLESALPPARLAPKPPVAMAKPPKEKPGMRVGADFEPPRQQTSNRGNDRFIEEDVSQARRSPGSRAPSSALPSQTDDDSFFVQIASFSVESRARTLARKLGGSVVDTGSVWRVRKGPFASAEAANKALGVVVAQGYRDARVAR